jgi:hypothetical protein
VLIDRDTLAVAVHRSIGGAPVRVVGARSAVLGCRFERVDDDRLRVVGGGAAAEVSP